MSSDADQNQKGVTQITVGGFKSIASSQSLEIRPLTILAGANSSGKTSFLQPLLLLKQTLDAPYDPGPLLLDGPNVKFTSGEQLLPRVSGRDPVELAPFQVGIAVGPDHGIKVIFSYRKEKGFRVERNESSGGRILKADMEPKDIRRDFFLDPNYAPNDQLTVVEDRCFLRVEGRGRDSTAASAYSPGYGLVGQIRGLIHLPALRGRKERTYPTAGLVGTTFSGTFDNYVASVLDRWQAEDEAERERLARLNAQLESIGLTRGVQAKRINEAQIELHVDRLPATSKSSADFVSIADVGFGVPSALPVVVALVAAQPGQVVYIEQPELHLHPRAQVKLAEVLADAAKRGVRVIAETHSSLLLRGIQTLVARGELEPGLVKLHWFTRSESDGATQIGSADLDENGAFGEWPMDFDAVELRSEGEYLDSVESRSR